MKKRLWAMVTSFTVVASTILSPGFTMGVIEQSEAHVVQAAEKTEELFTSHYFYDQLSDTEKDIYDAYKNSNGHEYITVTSDKAMTLSEWAEGPVGHAVGAFNADHPLDAATRIYHTGSLAIPSYEGKEAPEKQKAFKMLVQPLFNDENGYYERKARAEKERILKMVGTGDRYTILRRLMKYIHENWTHGDTVATFEGINRADIDNMSRLEQTRVELVAHYIGAMNGYPICAGMMDGVKVICDALDIPCITCGNYAHGWNLIQMENEKWYIYDATNFSKDVSWVTDWEESFLAGTHGASEHEAGDHVYGDPSTWYLGQPGLFTFPKVSTDNYTYDGSETNFGFIEEPDELTFTSCAQSGHKWMKPVCVDLDSHTCRYKEGFEAECLVCHEKRDIEDGFQSEFHGSTHGSSNEKGVYVMTCDNCKESFTFHYNPETTHKVGDTFRINPVSVPAREDDKDCWYESMNPKIAAVDEDGNVEAKAVGHTAIIVRMPYGTQFFVDVDVEDSVLSTEIPTVTDVPTETKSSTPAEELTIALTGTSTATTKPSAGIKNTVKKDGITYKLSGTKATVSKGVNKKSVTIAKTIKANGKTYKVTKIANNAFKGMRRIKTVKISSPYITAIGKNAFNGASKLSNIIIKSKQIKSIGANAFKNIKSNAKVKVPSSKVKNYRKLLKKAKLPSKARVSK